MMKGSKLLPMPPITNASRNYSLGYLNTILLFNCIPALITVHNFSDGYKSKPDNTDQFKMIQAVQKNENILVSLLNGYWSALYI
jgi:hypothetical protein